MIFGQPDDGAPEKVGTVLGLMLALLVMGIFALVVSPMLNFF